MTDPDKGHPVEQSVTGFCFSLTHNPLSYWFKNSATVSITIRISSSVPIDNRMYSAAP